MTWCLAQATDLPTIEEFLRRHLQSSMFPLANLRDFGLNGSEPRSLKIWMLGEPLRAVLAITNEGMLLPQCPDCTDVELEAVLKMLKSRPVIGVIGEAAQARRILQLAGWQNRPAILSRDEPAFSLELEQLIIPDLPGARVVPLSAIDRALAVHWRHSYHLESLGKDSDQAQHQAERDIDGYLSRDSHRALLLNNQPVCMTGFNAVLPEVVQIGGVYTPPELRRRGYARTAVALHLAETRAIGVSRAVLFAASDFAARAYIAVGFVRAGQFSVNLFKTEKEAAA